MVVQVSIILVRFFHYANAIFQNFGTSFKNLGARFLNPGASFFLNPETSFQNPGASFLNPGTLANSLGGKTTRETKQMMRHYEDSK